MKALSANSSARVSHLFCGRLGTRMQSPRAMFGVIGLILVIGGSAVIIGFRDSSLVPYLGGGVVWFGAAQIDTSLAPLQYLTLMQRSHSTWTDGDREYADTANGRVRWIKYGILCAVAVLLTMLVLWR